VASWTEFEITSFSEFERIAQENEYFFWYFVGRHQTLADSVTPIGLKKPNHPLESLRDDFGIKIFQSFTEDSYDFLIGLGYPTRKVWDKGLYAPAFVGFNRRRAVATNIDKCFCVRGITDIVYETIPGIFDSFLSVEEEDLK